MTPAEHIAQRDRVQASLRADDARETHRAVYPLRTRETGQDAAQTAHEFFAAVDAGPHDLGDASRLRQWCAFCESLAWCIWWREEDHPGCWACEDEDACHARAMADA